MKRENFGRMIKDGVHMGIMTKDQSERVLSEQPVSVYMALAFFSKIDFILISELF